MKRETIAALKSRYPAALKELFSVNDINRKLKPLPRTNPANCFHFMSGIVMVISLERQPDQSLAVHVAAHYENEKGQVQELNDTILHHMIEQFNLICDKPIDEIRMELVALSEMKMAHFLIRLDN